MYLMKRKVGPTINNPENIVVYYIFIVEQYKSPGTGGGGGCTPQQKNGWGCAARLLKSMIFLTVFMIYVIKNSIHFLRPDP